MALPVTWQRRASLAASDYPQPVRGREALPGDDAGTSASEVSAVPFQNILVERDESIAIVTINRPQVRNALNSATLRELAAAVDQLGADQAVRALVVTGAGDRAFVAGADINEIRDLADPQAAEAFSQVGQGVFYKLEQMPKPVIAAINGYALGGGAELALSADIRLAAETAKVGFSEINLGIFPGFGGTQRLPRLIGRSAAKLLIFTGEMIEASEAYRLGLVDRVYPAAELLPAARALAKTLATKAPVAIALAKQAIDQGLETNLERGTSLEVRLFGEVCASEDRVEGTRAFLEKRPPQFKGR
jgi:enoyl-CoA hydratase